MFPFSVQTVDAGTCVVQMCLGVFSDGVDLVRDKTVRLPVHRVGCLGVGGDHQAEDLPGRTIHPVAEIVHTEVALCGEIGRMRGGDFTRRYPTINRVDVHEQCHVLSYG
jgi:hypothetical protein